MQRYGLTDKEWRKLLEQEYIIAEKSANQIAREQGCASQTVIYRLRKYGFQVRQVLGSHLSKETKNKLSIANKGKNTWMKGRKLSREIRDKLSKAGMGHIVSQSTRKKISNANKERNVSKETREAISKSLKGRFVGKNATNWKGGITPKSQIIRMSLEYKVWRLAVYERDGYECVSCGDKCGGNLQAHHILSFAKYPKSRFDVSNGTTLCRDCHKLVHPDIAFIGLGA